MKLKFYWNGVKIDGGRIVNLGYSNNEDGSIRVVEGESSWFPQVIKETFNIVDRSDPWSDYRSYDHFDVKPGEPYFEEIRAACAARAKRAAAKEEAYLQKKIAKGGYLSPERTVSLAMIFHREEYPECPAIDESKTVYSFKSWKPEIALWDVDGNRWLYRVDETPCIFGVCWFPPEHDDADLELLTKFYQTHGTVKHKLAYLPQSSTAFFRGQVLENVTASPSLAVTKRHLNDLRWSLVRSGMTPIEYENVVAEMRAKAKTISASDRAA